MSGFDDRARAALESAGVAIGEDDLAVLRLVGEAFEPGMAALDALDVRALPFERDLDPGRPPRPPESS
jgi:hypothetical protein